MAYRVGLSTIPKFLLMASLAVFLIGAISVNGQDEEKTAVDPIPPNKPGWPCAAITCKTGYYCSVVRTKGCCETETICAECIPCPPVICEKKCCVPRTLENGCPVKPCICPKFPLDLVTDSPIKVEG